MSSGPTSPTDTSTSSAISTATATGANTSTSIQAQTNELEKYPEIQPPPQDFRPREQVICEDTIKIIEKAAVANFREEVAYICNGSNFTEAMKIAIQDAYNGNNEIKIQNLHFKADSLLTTDMVTLYALTLPIPDPTHLTPLRLHDALEKPNGIASTDTDKSKNSVMFVDVTDRQKFPEQNRLSVESLKLTYDLKRATGASLYDKRTTEINNYGYAQISARNDIALASEHLLNPENNVFYHDAKGLMIAMTTSETSTVVVFLSRNIVKNRPDPARIASTTLAITKDTITTLYDYAIDKLNQ